MILKIDTNCSLDTFIKRLFNSLSISLDSITINDIIDTIESYINITQSNNDVIGYLRDEIDFLRNYIITKEDKNHD